MNNEIQKTTNDFEVVRKESNSTKNLGSSKMEVNNVTTFGDYVVKYESYDLFFNNEHRLMDGYVPVSKIDLSGNMLVPINKAPEGLVIAFRKDNLNLEIIDTKSDSIDDHVVCSCFTIDFNLDDVRLKIKQEGT